MADEHADDQQHARVAVIRAPFAWQAAHRALLGGTAVQRFQQERQRSAAADRSMSRAADELRAASNSVHRHPDPVSRSNP